jgi:hypothetical protein
MRPEAEGDYNTLTRFNKHKIEAKSLKNLSNFGVSAVYIARALCLTDFPLALCFLLRFNDLTFRRTST